AVLLLGHLLLRARPDGFHGVERLAPEAHGVPDEVGVVLDNVAQDRCLGIVPEAVLLVPGLQMQRDGRPGRLAVGLGDLVAVARRLPARGRGLTGLAADQRDPVGHHETRVEPDAELADELERHLTLLLAHSLYELARAR